MHRRLKVIILFDRLLKTALESDITPEIALQILQESKEQKNALKLFEASSRLRDEKIGKDLWLSSGISGVIPCKVVPKCTYCTYFTTESFQIDKLSLCVKEIEKLGIKHIHLSGRTNIDGYDKEIISMIESIRKVSDIDIEINLGPSFSEETVKVFRDLDVKSITSSLEIFNEDLFKKAKPGDSLDKRKELIEICDKHGMSVRSMMLIGLGETYEDRIQHLFYLRKVKNLYHLRFSRFYPYPNTACNNHPRCSPWLSSRK